MLFDDSYHTLAAPSEGQYKEKGSRFLSYAYPVRSAAEVRERLLSLRNEHPSANHHCYAYRLGADKSQFRASDDGEPSNTAGRPILSQLQSQDLTNVLIVVVRYFGGTLLGVGGLINAYKSAAAEALARAEIITRHIEEVYEITFRYEQLGEVMKIAKNEAVKIDSQDLHLPCRIRFSVIKTAADSVTSALRKVSGLEIQYISTL
jgi:uncharacterized YigZ family protein